MSMQTVALVTGIPGAHTRKESQVWVNYSTMRYGGQLWTCVSWRYCMVKCCADTDMYHSWCDIDQLVWVTVVWMLLTSWWRVRPSTYSLHKGVLFLSAQALPITPPTGIVDNLQNIVQCLGHTMQKLIVTIALTTECLLWLPQCMVMRDLLWD